MRHLRIVLLLIVAGSMISAAKERAWATGMLVKSDTERGTRTVGIPSTVGSGPMIASLRNDVTFYTIDDGKYVWVVSRRMTKKNDKPLDLTINAPVKFAVENGDCYLLDNEGKEHKLLIEKKTLKPDGSH